MPGDDFLGLKSPRLGWSDDGSPRDLDHDDGYFSDTDGLGESRAVFLQGCHLPQAWQDRTLFHIAELGFGTGLNFLNVWQAWRHSRNTGARLHFTSIEAAPLSLASLQRAHEGFSALQGLAQGLRQHWPAPVKGVHRLFFDEDGLALTLWLMDVAEALPQMEAPADAWFLDGFAPSRNGEMWSDAVFANVARLSKKGSRAATFSVAGAVRRGFQNAGFSVRKMPGHGRKRQRLEARYDGPVHPPSRRATRPAARAISQAASVLVIGGGIGGASVAHALLRRGLAVSMICKNGLGDEASGNAAALVSPRLDLEDAPPARFFRTAFAHAVRFYGALGASIWTPCGLVRLPAHDKDESKFARLAAAAALPADELILAQKDLVKGLTGKTGGKTALHIRSAGIVVPKTAILAITRGAKVHTATVAALDQDAGQWCARDADGAVIARAPLAVLALGAGSLPQTAGLDFRRLHGQVSLASVDPAHDGPAVIADGYGLGLEDGRLLFGADFMPLGGDVVPPMATKAADQANLARLRGFSPALAARLDTKKVQGRASVRAATPDQMPYAGPLVDEADFITRFAALRHGFIDPKAGSARLQEGLYVLMGLGARGFTLAPILGEAIACQALGEPSPLERRTTGALHPARVLEKMLKSERFN